MNDSCTDWVADLLPPMAVETLVKAAAEARRHPEESINRKSAINHAIEKVHQDYPELFEDPASDRSFRLPRWRVERPGKVP